MLDKRYRLTAEKDFAKLFAKGRAFQGRGVTVKAMRSRNEGPRIGFVVSTKVSKRAVVRNLVKRRMREIVRKRLPKLLGGVDMAILARSEAVTMDFQALERSIDDVLTKAGLYKRP
ncbi:MAG TPA: ribonuclease P protein component [Candidatus Binatia bacterium]|jgi:ribonuclease P protein component|nr:ribonuclease P protein component [Candidatus Binatia bacterium]